MEISIGVCDDKWDALYNICTCYHEVYTRQSKKTLLNVQSYNIRERSSLSNLGYLVYPSGKSHCESAKLCDQFPTYLTYIIYICQQSMSILLILISRITFVQYPSRSGPDNVPRGAILKSIFHDCLTPETSVPRWYMQCDANFWVLCFSYNFYFVAKMRLSTNFICNNVTFK